MPIIKSQFKPAWWLRNPHLQTMWGILMRRHQFPPLHEERLELPDDDFIDVAWGRGMPDDAPVVLLLHGLGGSLQSHYIPGTLRAVVARGWRPLFVHFRGCSEEPNRKPGSYHFGYIDDLEYVAQLMRQRFPNAPLCVVGYSLGGNVVLKWLAQRTHVGLKAAVAVCVPFRPDSMVEKLNHGFSRIYQKRFIRELKEFYMRKYEVCPEEMDADSIKNIGSLREWDDKVTAPMWGFADAQDYYLRTSSMNDLQRINTPTLIIHATDDPFMTEACTPQPEQLSSDVTVELSKAGGHVGFVSGQWPWRANYWLESRIPEFLAMQL
jgi:uncharacterized protein